MRTYPEDKEDWEYAKRLKAEPWMLEMLKKNPSYVFWGNDEGYMSDDTGGWDSPVAVERVDDLWELDNLNEVVHFYFDIHRDGKECPGCQGKWYNSATVQLQKSLWNYENPEYGWAYALTQEEIELLIKNRGLKQLVGKTYSYDEKTGKWSYEDETTLDSIDCEAPVLPTPEEYRAWATKHRPIIHDHRLLEHRARKLGIWGYCETCDGHGYVYTADKAKLRLQLWVLHPRKGASRGVRVEEVKPNEVPKVIEYLKTAWERNNERFSQLDVEPSSHAVIFLSEGNVEHVISDRTLGVTIVDWETEGLRDYEITKVSGDEAYVYRGITKAEVNAERVAQVKKDIKPPPPNDAA